VQLFDFIADCEKDDSAKVDVFAYDLDEPRYHRGDLRIGKEGRLRAILDDADLHSKPDKKTGVMPVEVDAAKMIIAAAGKDNVRQGHFARYQHNKVFIKRDANGNAERVIFGSMNFSVRGIYVQANNVVVVDDPTVAGMFAKAFGRCVHERCEGATLQEGPDFPGLHGVLGGGDGRIARILARAFAAQGFSAFRSARCRIASARRRARCSSR